MASNYVTPYTGNAKSQCEICDRGMDTRFYCKECKQTFCVDCKTKHLKMKVSRNHTVISIVTDSNASVDDRMCRTHPNAPIHMYCVTCNLLICLDCTVDKTHQNHDFYQHRNVDDLKSDITRVDDAASADKKYKTDREQTDKPGRLYKPDPSVGTSVNISTDVISHIKPGVKCYIVSAVSDTEAWCGPGLNNGTDLVLVQTCGKVTIKEKLDTQLYDVTVTSSGNILFTQARCEIKKRYLSDGRVTSIHASIEPYNEAFGLCMTSDKDILVCLSGSVKSVVRMTLGGQITQTIQYKEQKKPLYRNPLVVAENINGDICVVDNSDTVIVVNKGGQYKFNYPESQKSAPHSLDPLGIACDKLGYILISDLVNHRIHLVNSDGVFVQFVVTKQHGIVNPWGLSVDNCGQLWVCNRHGKEVTVYKYRS